MSLLSLLLLPFLGSVVAARYELHEWLLSIRPPDRPWRAPPGERPPKEETIERDAARVALRDRLVAGDSSAITA